VLELQHAQSMTNQTCVCFAIVGVVGKCLSAFIQFLVHFIEEHTRK